MGSTNLVVLLGNLGADPEVRYTQGGTAVANMRVATNENYVDNAGTKHEKVEWHRVTAWGNQAKACGEYLSKGRQVQVIGKLQTREWTDKENRKQYTTEIVASQVVFVGGSGTNRRPEPPPPADELEGRGFNGARGPARSQGQASGPTPDDFGPPPPGFDEVSGGTPMPSDDDIPF